MKYLFTNNARGTLKIAMTALQTTLTLDAGQGALFPNPGALEAFRASIVDSLGNIEIVECTTRAADGFTVITRGKEGTTARAFNVGDRVSLRVTKEILESLRDGGNLGTMAQQNANAVAITGGTIGGQTIGATTGSPLPRSYLSGYLMANDAGDLTNDINVGAGSALDSGNTHNIVRTAALIKQLDAVWAVGTNAGMRASGAAIANGTYHIFAILRPDTSVVDIAADTSATGANIAANTNAAYTKLRRIGSILREAGAIVAFAQYGDEFQRPTVLDVSAANPGAVAVDRTLSVPDGIKVQAIVNANRNNGGSTGAIYLSPKDTTDEAPSGTVTPLATVFNAQNVTSGGGPYLIRTNTARVIRSRDDSGAADVTIRIATLGWIDRRGRDE